MSRIEQIGDCTLYLGNCLDVLPTLQMTGHVISDPPYEKFMHRAKENAARRIRTDGRRELRCVDFDAIDGIRGQFVAASSNVCDAWFIVFCTPEGVGKWADEINNSPMKYKRACFWHKPDATPQLNGQGPSMAGESIVCAWSGSGHAHWNSGGKRGYYRHLTNPPDRGHEHPTEKPWRLMAEILHDFTAAGDVVIDPFMGSGTTGVACAKLGRKFTGIEINENYFDIACRRIEESYKQPDLFVASPEPKPEQLTLLEAE